jgi:hypothetical protein
MYLGTLGNIILACSTNFHCKIFIPTLDYLGCFRGHDRIFIVTCTFYALVLPIMYFGWNINFKNTLKTYQKILMVLSGLVSCLSLVLLALVDEVNGVYFISYELLFKIFSKLFMLSNVIWVVIAYFNIRKVKSIFNSNEMKWYRIFNIWCYAFLAVLIFTLV